jgi:hypothetical protein
MDLSNLFRDFRLLWEKKPGTILLLGIAFLLFAFLVIDTWCHKRRRKRRHLPHNWRP